MIFHPIQKDISSLVPAIIINGIQMEHVDNFINDIQMEHVDNFNFLGICLDSNLMMTSSNGNIFHVTGLLCGEFTGQRWIPHTKASDAELWCYLWSAPE